MDEEIEVKCYHATKKDNQELILNKGFKESEACKGYWLGKGVYFYKNIYYAVEWVIIKFIKDNEYEVFLQNGTILKATINCKDYDLLDLNDPIGYKTYSEIIHYIKNKFPEKILKIERSGDIEIIRLIEEIEKLTGEKYISLFDILIANYPKDIYKKGNSKKNGDFLPCIQKQICVKNKDAIENIETMDLNDNVIKNYFDIIKKNREEN